MSILERRAVTVVFSGYRPSKIFRSGYDPLLEARIRQAIYQVVLELYDEGYRVFFSGLAPGFDMWAAQAVVSLKQAGRCPAAELHVALPFPQQADDYNPCLKREYQYLLFRADEVRALYSEPDARYYRYRDNYMVSLSAVLVCYHDGQRGETDSVCQKALCLQLKTINLHQRLLLNPE